MEERTKIALSMVLALTGLQIVAWYSGHNGAITQLIGTSFGLIVGYYFGKKTITN